MASFVTFSTVQFCCNSCTILVKGLVVGCDTLLFL